MKRCARCGETKPHEMFHKAGKRHLQSRCKPCATLMVKEWRDANPEKYRAYRIKQGFGISAEQYDKLMERQGSVCAACGKPESAIGWKSGKVKRLAVDHDHSCCPGESSCGRCVRGLLCTRCNLGCGYFDDDPEILERMAQYLRHQAPLSQSRAQSGSDKG